MYFLSPIRCKVKITNLDYSYLLKFDLKEKSTHKGKNPIFFFLPSLYTFPKYVDDDPCFIISNIFSKSCSNFLSFGIRITLQKFESSYGLRSITKVRYTPLPFHVGWSCLRRQIGLAEQTLVHRLHAFHIKVILLLKFTP